MGMIYFPLVTKTPFLMVCGQYTIVKDRQTNIIGSHAMLTFCSIAKIDRKKSKYYIKKTSRFKIVAVTADPMTLIKQQIFSTNKINPFCVTCCQIIIVPLQTSSLFNWAKIAAMQYSFAFEYETFSLFP